MWKHALSISLVPLGFDKLGIMAKIIFFVLVGSSTSRPAQTNQQLKVIDNVLKANPTFSNP